MDIERLRASVLAHYSSKENVEYYDSRSSQGLRIWERRIVDRYMSPGRVLTVGCGGGRESFALEKLGFEVYGMDICEEQVNNARKNARERSSLASFALYDGNTIPHADGFFRSITLWSQVLGNIPGSRVSLSWY